jgi:hypothetical protein
VQAVKVRVLSWAPATLTFIEIKNPPPKVMGSPYRRYTFLGRGRIL